jgi:hypothetical protein
MNSSSRKAALVGIPVMLAVAFALAQFCSAHNVFLLDSP